MYRKFRSTIIRRHEGNILSDEEEYAYSEASSFMSDERTYFPQKEFPIAPIFQFSLASSLELKKGEDLQKQIQFHPDDNIIRLNPSYQGIEKVLQLLNCKTSIRCWKHIKHLAINFRSWITNWHKTLREFKCMIADITKSFPSVQYLHLNFQESHYSDKFNEKELIWVSFHITTYMPNLKHLFIKFLENFSITEEGFRRFCSQIAKRSKRLESLILDFSKCQNIPEDFLKPLTHFATSYLRHLKDFRIIPPKTPVADMKEIHFNKTRYLKQLESLDLYLNSRENAQFCFSTQETALSKKLKNDLKHLTLYFVPFNDDKEKKGLDYLSSRCLRYLQNLKVLNLYLGNLDVDSETAQTFFRALNAQIGSLEQIKFQFTNCGLLTGTFLEEFQCPEKNQLKKLEMQFIAENEEFFLQPFSSFTLNSMQNLKNLTHLDLLFDRVKITTKQVKLLTSCIAQNLTQLEFLNINFFLCSEINEGSVTVFQKDFCSETALPNLKILFLTFSSCSRRITQKKIDTLKVTLQKKKPHLESTIVYFLDNHTDSDYEPSGNEEDFYGDEIDFKCKECRKMSDALRKKGMYAIGVDTCRAHRRESDNSDENLTDFMDDDDDDF